MNTAKNLLSLFLELPLPERDAFLVLAKGVHKPSAKGEQQDLSSLQLLYGALEEEAMSLVGLALPHFGIVRRWPEAITHLQALEVWLINGSPITAGEKHSLFRLAAWATVREWRTQGGDRSRETIVQMLRSVPLYVNNAFPGYKAGGVLIAVARLADQNPSEIRRREGEG